MITMGLMNEFICVMEEKLDMLVMVLKICKEGLECSKLQKIRTLFKLGLDKRMDLFKNILKVLKSHSLFHLNTFVVWRILRPN